MAELLEPALEQLSIAEALEEIVETVHESVLKVRQHVAGLRNWIENEADLSWVKDDDFLHRFVKHSDEDHTEGQNRIRNLLSIRKKHARWFENLNPNEPKILELLSQGWFLLLPEKDDAGRQLYIVRLGLDITDVESVNWQRALAVFFDYLYLIENKDKTGNVTIADFAGATLESFGKIMPADDLKEWNDLHAKLYPSQVSIVHYLNATDLDAVAEVIQKSIEDEDTELKLHDSLEGLYEDVPKRCLPVEYLPADYTGPNAGTIADLIEYTKTTLLSHPVQKRLVKFGKPKWRVGGAEKQQQSEGDSSK